MHQRGLGPSWAQQISHPGLGLTVFPLETPTVPPFRHTTCVVLQRGEEALVIEPCTADADQIEAFAKELARHGVTRVMGVLLTHHHHDHSAGLVRFCQRFECDWFGSEITGQKLGLQPSMTLDASNSIHVEPVLTEGHANGHLAYWIPEARVLVAGDMVSGAGTILIDPDDDGDLRLYLHSLDALMKLGADVVIPAHGPIRDGKVLDETFRHRMARVEQVEQFLNEHPHASSQDIADVLYPNIPAPWHVLAEKSVRATQRYLASRTDI